MRMRIIRNWKIRSHKLMFSLKLSIGTVTVVAAAIIIIAFPSHAWGQAEVNVYSARQEILIRPQLDAFTAMTGVRVNLVSGKDDALIERLRAEGPNSPADLLLTVDVGRLVRAKQTGLLQAVKSESLIAPIPTQYRDSESFWFGLAVRSRVIYFSPERVDVAELSTYEDLADDRWRGLICIRSSSNVYNQSLLASLIVNLGVVEAEAWAARMVKNMARPPQGGDRDQISAVAAGECDIAVGNTYYYAGMLNGTDRERETASGVRLFWPNQNGRGAHVNVSGGGVAAYAPNRENAILLLEYLVSEEAQRIYAEVVYEYPVRANVPVAPTLSEFGEFKADTIDLEEVAAHQAEALRIFDRVGWR